MISRMSIQVVFLCDVFLPLACTHTLTHCDRLKLISSHCAHCCCGLDWTLLTPFLPYPLPPFSSGNEKLLTAERNHTVERMLLVAQKLSLG